MADISKIKLPSGSVYDLKDATARSQKAPKVNGIYYGVCDTAQATKAKEVTLTNGDGFELVVGAMVMIKFTYGSAASTMTLNVNGTGAKNLYQYGTTLMTNGTTTGWQAGAVELFTYDGTGWFRKYFYNTNTTYNISEVLVATAAATAAKVSTNAVYYVLTPGNWFECTTRYANTAASAITLNINNTGAVPIYINGNPSSASNYTLPAGHYFVYYDGAAYQFRTDGTIPGTAYNAVFIDGHTVQSDVPTNAVFTDTKYTATKENIGSASAGTAISADDITAWNAGSAPSLTVTDTAVDDITGWSAGTSPSLTVTSVSCDDITAWTSNAPTSSVVSDGVLTITTGSAASLSYTARSVGSASGWNKGALPTLTYTARTIGSASNWNAGSVPSLSYTARTIPNISVTTKSVVTDVTEQ